MSRGINKVILVGRVGKDPEEVLTGKTPCTKLSLATNAEWPDGKGGIKKETQWHRLVFFKKIGEMVAQYVKKGALLFVEGSLKTSHWKDKQTGEDRYVTEVIVREVQFLNSKKELEKATNDENFDFDNMSFE